MTFTYKPLIGYGAKKKSNEKEGEIYFKLSTSWKLGVMYNIRIQLAPKLSSKTSSTQPS
jgi:hypothetical protein